MNLSPAGARPLVYLNTNDQYDVDPSTSALIGGTLPVALNFVTKTPAATVLVAPQDTVPDRVCTGNGPSNICLAQSPAAASIPFRVFASTAIGLQVTLPGETQKPGKCDYLPGVVCRTLLPAEGPAGKDGTPNQYVVTSPAMTADVWLVDQFYNPVSDIAAGPSQDTNPPAVMPTVRLSFPYDGAAGVPPGAALILGNRQFNFSPLTAATGYTVVASTTAASAVFFSSRASAAFAVQPGPINHLVWSGLPANAVAGVTFSGVLSAHDQYDNVLSTGPNAYRTNVTFKAEIFGGNQDPIFSPSSVLFSSTTDLGSKSLPGFLSLKKAGVRWVEAHETLNAALTSELGGDSIRPLITVSPAAPDSIKVTPTADVEQDAGTLVPSAPGSLAITGQLTDAFDNPITSTQTVYVEVVSTVGASGRLSVGGVDVGFSTQVISDSLGQVGISTAIRYFVSSNAGDSARIWIGTMTAPSSLAGFIAAQKDISGAIVTVGGPASQIVFVTTPTAVTVGINEVSGAGGIYAIQRLDDFGNVTRFGTTPISLAVAETAVHTARGYNLGLFGNIGDYGFRDAGNTQFITGFSIDPGFTGAETTFRYHDRMSSYSGPSPSSNTAEGGRPGLWSIQMKVGVAVKATHQLRADPDVIKTVAFGNPVRNLVAGRVVDFSNNPGIFRPQLQDIFANPAVTTAPIVVTLSTGSRRASYYNDYVGFSRSSDSFAGSRVASPSFLVSTQTVDIPIGSYSATFYYLDTTASNGYALPGSPTIALAVPGLVGSAQEVLVSPDGIDGLAISSGAGQGLLAGATSQVFSLEASDYYGNASPVRPGQDLGLGYVQVRLESDSLGQIAFSTPTPGNFTSTSAVAYILVNQSATSFYLIDTLLTTGTTAEITATGITYPTWNVARASYTVLPGQPAQIGWYNPSRRLVAGTTVEYLLGVPTNTVIAAELRDMFGNVTTSTATFTMRYTSPGLTTYGGVDPTAVIIATAPTGWRNLNALSLDVPIPGGAALSQAPMYAWDTIAGGTTIQAQALLGGNDVFTPITQVQTITPGPASYMTLHHPYTPLAPLPVTNPGTIVVKARDKFGNVAAGDPQNGNYYTGIVSFMSSGSTTTVTLRDPIANATFHIFTPAEQGVFSNLSVTDIIQEVLKVRTSDQYNPDIWGITADGARTGLPSNVALRSDGDVELVGIVVTPKDLAPESTPPPNGPIPADKIAAGVTKKTLNQGDGNVPTESPDPIPMMRLSMQVAATQASALASSLSSMRVQSRAEGNFDNLKVTELGLWFDANANGRYDPPPAGDIMLGTGAYDGSGTWYFGSATFGQTALEIVDPVNTVINNTNRNFFLTVRLSTTGYAPNELPASFGLQLQDPSNITLATGLQVRIAADNFAIRTATSSVERQPARINVQATDINAWWQPPSLALSSYSYINQGMTNVGVARLDMWTDAFSGVISKITLSHQGGGLDQHISKVRLYLDTQPNQITTPGNGTFEFSIDKQVAEATFPSGETGQVSLTINDPTGMNGTILTSTKTYFVAFDIAASAAEGQRHGVKITNSQIVPLSGNGVINTSFAQFTSTDVPVIATPDQVVLTDWNRQGVVGSTQTDAIPSRIAQNDKNQPVAKMTLRVNSGAAEWTGLKLDRWLPSVINNGAVSANKATDVTNIRVWLDRDGDGLLQTSTDTQVSPQNSTLHVFPTAIISTPVAPGDTQIYVDQIGLMFPADNPFPNDQVSRLVLNDGQTDEGLKEVVLCTGLDQTNGIYTNCARGQEGTVAQAYSTGTVLSGPARIPIQALVGGGGQVVETVKLDYFVTYDLHPLATVSTQANIGLAIPNTSYIQIKDPKTISALNVSLPSLGGRSASFISQVTEYADFVKVTSSDTFDGAIGPFAQQKSTVAVASILVAADVADAPWRWLLVYATGTATAGGSVATDVDATQLWYDANNDGLFNPPSGDILVGSGTFGNYQGLPLVSQIVLNPVRKIVTAALATQPQRYFVAYKISETALPTDTLTQQPRSLGVSILASSLPTNDPVNDNVFQNALALPNRYDPTSPLPFYSKSRDIVAAPQTMFVRATPYFSSSSGTFPAPLLTTPILALPAGTIESSWILTSTMGLPSPAAGTTAYALVDGEIVGYTAFNAAVPAILNVERGALNTLPAAHSTGAVVSPTINQGDNNVAAVRLDVWTAAFQVQLSEIRFNRSLPTGLNGDDPDLNAVRVYKSIDGIFKRDPVTGIDAGDIPLGEARFGTPPDTSGRATIPINDPNIGSPGYMIVTSTPTTLYVAFDVSPAAKFSHPTLTPPNEVVGVSVTDPARFKLTPTLAGHNTVFVGTAPIASPTFVIGPTVNQVTATFDQISGNTAKQNDKNVAMLRINMKTDRNTALVQKLRFTRTGTPGSLDSDVTILKVWADSNGNAVFDPADSTVTALGDRPYLLSFGNETFSSGTVTITLRTPIVVSTTPADYFLTYDISQFAAEGNGLGVAILDPTYFTVQVPNTVFLPQTSFTSNPLLQVTKVTSRVILGVSDIASGIRGVTQAQTNVSLLRFSMATDIALAPWRALRLERGGGSQDTAKPLGRNTDVKFVRLFKDINQDDLLDVNDVNISEANTTLAVAVSSTTNPPFDLVVASTKGFPLDSANQMIGGRLWINSAELMTYSGPGCQTAFTPGIDNITGKPCVAVTSRGDNLGLAPTPRLTLSVGTSVKKVDVFDQNADANVQTLVTLNGDQYVGPTAQAFFVAYDIGDSAIQNDLVNVTIRDPSWIGLPRGDNADVLMLTGITRTNPLGTGSTSYPYVGGNVPISPITLAVDGFSLAPAGAGQGDANVPIMQINLQTSSDFVNIAAVRIKQTGTILTSTTALTGDGTVSRIKAWLDNGDRVFTPATDALMGDLVVSTAGAFSAGVALVPLTVNSIPYLRVTTKTAVMFFSADVGFTDRAGGSTLNQLAGFQLANFTDLIDPGGAPLTAAADPLRRPPLSSKEFLVAMLTVPGVSVSSAVPPIIMTRAGTGVPGEAVGYPAYALVDQANCNNGKDPVNPRNNICYDSNANPLPNQTKWICQNGLPWPANCAGSPPLIDVNGDGSPDNFKVGESSRPTSVSLLGDGNATTDLTGTGILDVDINKDGIVDLVIFSAGSNKPSFRIGLDVADQGNLAKTAPDPGQGLSPSAWAKSAGSLSFNLPVTGTSGYYQVAVGAYYDDPIGITHKWSSVTAVNVAGLSVASYGVMAGSEPITSATLTNLVLEIPNVTRLTQTLTQETTFFTVVSNTGLLGKTDGSGLVYIGSEIMRVKRGPTSNTFEVIYQDGDPPPYTGRGLRGSAPIIHTSGELVSDAGAILFAQFVSAQGSVSPPQPMWVYRVDPSAPTTPGAAVPLEQGKPTFAVKWTASQQFVSGVAAYEVQERGGDPKNLSETVIWRTINVIPSRLTTYNVGDPSFAGEGQRKPGQFFSYRVRAISGAGVSSNWSPLAASAGTGVTSEIVTGVSNYPNPFDSRKGGDLGMTKITYILNGDSDVTISIYDALGYLVKTISCPPGTEGGKLGQNFVPWNGRNDAGVSVSKGGYVARIKVKAPGGSATVIRKIGVIH